MCVTQSYPITWPYDGMLYVWTSFDFGTRFSPHWDLHSSKTSSAHCKEGAFRSSLWKITKSAGAFGSSVTFCIGFAASPWYPVLMAFFSLTWWIFPWKKPIDDIFPSNIIKWKLMIWMKSPRGWIHYKRICIYIYISNIILNGNMDEMMKCFFPYHRPSLISSIDFTDYIIDISPVKYEY